MKATIRPQITMLPSTMKIQPPAPMLCWYEKRPGTDAIGDQNDRDDRNATHSHIIFIECFVLFSLFIALSLSERSFF
jgi:hypothetical protein